MTIHRRLHIVHTESSLGWGGQELRVLSEAQGFIERGYCVTLLAPAQARITAEAGRFGVPVVALPLERKSWVGVWALRRWLAAHAVDVINTHSSTDTWLSALSLLGWFPCPRLKPVLVRTRHISAPVASNWATCWLYRIASRKVVTTGEALRTQLITDNGLRPARVLSVPTGIDTAVFRPVDQAGRQAVRAELGLPLDGPLLGIVATLRSWKGHRYLLEALAQFSPALSETQLLIVGDGPQRQALENQAQASGLAGRVRFVGNQHNVVPWLQAMNVFALPSYANEGVPQALMQAMSCGLPCVTTHVGAIAELAQHEQTALVVPAEDSAALAAACARLLSDEGLAARLGQAARSHAVAHCSRREMLDRMEAVFWAAVER